MNYSTIVSPSKVKDAYLPFNASLPFHVFIYSSQSKLNQVKLTQLKKDIAPPNEDDPNTKLEEVDIFKSVGEEMTRVYIFDTRNYPVSDDLNLLAESRKKLQLDLHVASRDRSGTSIKSTSLKKWGGNTAPPNYKRFEIQCSRKYDHTSTSRKEEKLTRTENNNYKLACLNGARKIHNVSHGNKGLARKSKTSFDEERKCTCRSYYIFNNSKCFFMIAPNDQGVHVGHKNDFSCAGSSQSCEDRWFVFTYCYH